MTFTKLDQADLVSPLRELSNGGLRIVVALPVRSGNIFSCACTGGPIQLCKYIINSLVKRAMSHIPDRKLRSAN